MINRKRTPFRPKLALLREVFSAQVALNALLLFAVALFTCAAPSIALRELTESEAPFEQEPVEQDPIEKELSEEESVISQQTRARSRRCLPKSPLLVLENEGSRFFTQATHAPHSGHRLFNNLLAPLRC